ncbi:MAG: phosphatase PAP2 family protein [Patescibacteria group bacterium]
MSVDVFLLHAVNGLTGKSGALDAFGIFSAVILLPVLFLLLLPVTFSAKSPSHDDWWQFVLKASTAALVAYGFVRLIWLFVFRARPFLAFSDIKQLIAFSPELNSFPSGHASVAFALAFMVWRADRIWGIVFLILAALISLGRVFVGVHYPFDIVGGVLVGYLTAFTVRWIDERENGTTKRRM